MTISAEDELAVQLTGASIYYVRQFPYAEGRRVKADFRLEGTKILVEVNGGLYRTKNHPDGGAHGSVKGILLDIERLNLATLNGYFMLRFSPKQVESGEALAVITQIVQRPKTG